MCLLVFAWRPDAAERLVLAGNRDEFHDRPAAPADWWENGTLGGRDLRAGGTWLAAHRNGRFAVVTNYREPLEEGRGPRSRGELVTGFLDGGDARGLRARRGRARTRVRGLQPAAGQIPDVRWSTSQTVAADRSGWRRGLRALQPPARHARGRSSSDPARFRALLARGADPERCWRCSPTAPATDHELPDTGIGPEWERLLSSPFIVSPHYGTRCSTVLKLEDQEMEFIERRFDPDGEMLASRASASLDGVEP
jgi:uncharacterized protein with NRDE domain